MAMYTVQVEHFSFHPDASRGEDGAVYYLILTPCEECKTNPAHHCCEVHPGMVHHYERQAFRRGTSGHRPGATPEEITNDCANVWGWDGNEAAPTILPSFLAMERSKDGQHIIRPYRMHSFLRGGRLELCGDSTVILHPNPQSCWYR